MSLKTAVIGLCGVVAPMWFLGNASAETLTWRLQNNSGELAMLELYSKSRPNVWPGNRKVYYVPADGQTHSYPISCVAGEYICYGAWVGRQPNLYWGAGRGARQGCSDCCYRCTGGETQVHNLIEGGC